MKTSRSDFIDGFNSLFRGIGYALKCLVSDIDWEWLGFVVAVITLIFVLVGAAWGINSLVEKFIH